MRSIFFMLSACSAVAQATECQVADETTMLQGLRMESGSVARQQKRMKATGASLDGKHLVKSLQHVAHNLDTMSTEEVNQALAEAAEALATLSPAIQEQVEILQNAVLHAAAAVQACHVEEGVEQRAALWAAAEAQSAEVTTCEAELATAVEDQTRICDAASVADVQSECACNEATVRREDKEELCAALTTSYEFAYCEHNLQCTTYHDCHQTETAVYNQVRSDVEDDMGPIEQEYIAAQQSTCIMLIIQSAMLTGDPIDFAAIAACSAVDTGVLLIVFPDLPAAPEACPAATTGSPSCGVNYLVDGCATAGTAHTTEAASSGATGSVRCCSLDGSSCDSDHLDGGCQEEKTFSEAQTICEANGERLCTEEEIDGGICCGTGCNFDSHHIWVTPVPHRVTVDGCPTAGSSPVRASAPDDSGVTASVRCCTGDGSGCVTQDLDGGCQAGKSFLEARDLCEANGLRLCTESEISDGTCCSSGCNYDSHSIWVYN